MRIVAVLSCRDQYFHPWLCQIMIQLCPICYKDLCSLLVWSITLSKHVKSPVYEFTDWKLPLVAFTHLIRNSFTTCRGSFNYLLMTETWKLYHVHYKRSIYTCQSTLAFIPLASLDSHMAWGLITGIHGFPQRVLICLTNSEICCDFHLVKKVQVKILKSTTKSKKKNHQAKFSHEDTAFHECMWQKRCLGNSK